MYDITSYCKADSLAEAVELLRKNPEAKLIAGGTDVLIRLREGHKEYAHLVDIHDLPELGGIELTADGDLVVGSGVTFSRIIESELIIRYWPVLAQGASFVGGPQVRNAATVGGNICNGAPSADAAAPLLIGNARVALTGADGTRDLPLADFYLGPGRVDLKPTEVMTSLRLMKNEIEGWSARFYKYAMRQAMDIATIGCAAAVKLDGEILKDLRLAYTVAGPTPLRCPLTEEKIRGMKVGQTLFNVIKDQVLSDLKPRNSWRAAKDFREHLIKTLAERVIKEAIETAGAEKND